MLGIKLLQQICDELKEDIGGLARGIRTELHQSMLIGEAREYLNGVRQMHVGSKLGWRAVERLGILQYEGEFLGYPHQNQYLETGSMVD